MLESLSLNRKRKKCEVNMKLNFDEFSFQDQINFMNLNYQMESQQLKTKNNSSIGFNEDSIYRKVEE